jgi:hypothetical protein
MFEFIGSLQEIYNNVLEVLKKKTLDTLLSAFWFGNYYFAVVEKHLGKYKSNWIVQKIFYRTPIMSEPPLDEWFSCFSITKSEAKYSFNEKYSYSHEEESQFGGDDVEKLYISKKNGYRVSKIVNAEINYNKVVGEPEKSRGKFISILYGHKNMSNMLTLKLDPEYLRDGNHLFSKSFVLRLLNYQYSAKEYVFDDDYELKVMDGKVHTEVLNSGSYMVIDVANKQGYTVVQKQ